MKYVLVLVSIISAALASQPAQSQITSAIGVFLNQTEKALQNFTVEIAREQCSAANSQNISIKECFDFSFNYTKKIYLQYKPIAIKTINDAAHNVNGTYFIIDKKSGSGILKGNPAVKVDDAVSANTNILVSRLKKVLEDIISQDEGTGLKRRSRFSFLGKIFGKGGSTAIDDITKAPTNHFSGHSVEPPRHQSSFSSPNSARQGFDENTVVHHHYYDDVGSNYRPNSAKMNGDFESQSLSSKGSSISHSSDVTMKKNWLSLSFNSLFRTSIGKIMGIVFAGVGVYAIYSLFRSFLAPPQDSAQIGLDLNGPNTDLSADSSFDISKDPFDASLDTGAPSFDTSSDLSAGGPFDTTNGVSDSSETEGTESSSQPSDIYDNATGYYWTFDTMVGQYYRIDDSTFEIIYYQG